MVSASDGWKELDMTDKIEWGGTEGPWRVYEGEYPGIESASHVSIIVYGEEHENEVGIRGTYPYENDRYINARAIAEVPAMVVALRQDVEAYDNANPMRQADMHRASCVCQRCLIDTKRAILVRIDKGE